MTQKTYKPGETAKTSGQGVIVGPRGGVSKTEVTIVKDKTIPPTPKPNSTIKIIDETKHKK